MKGGGGSARLLGKQEAQRIHLGPLSGSLRSLHLSQCDVEYSSKPKFVAGFLISLFLVKISKNCLEFFSKQEYLPITSWTSIVSDFFLDVCMYQCRVMHPYYVFVFLPYRFCLYLYIVLFIVYLFCFCASEHRANSKQVSYPNKKRGEQYNVN